MRAEHPSPLCAAPWVAMEFDPFGNVQACCANALHPLGNITRERLPEIWHGPRADALREALAAGDLTRGCDICRHRLHHPGGEIPLEYYNQFARPGAPTTWPRLLSFSLHNTCNLACVMCGADLSSKIRSTRSDLPPLPHVYGDEFFEDLVPFLVACEAIDFAGGEPFLVREHRRVWELLAELGVRPTTSVTTNGTVWNDHVEWVLDTFSPNICVSVDAMDPTTFEAVRVGARFDEVMANIERFEQQAEATGSGVYLSFSMTRHNWSELAPVLRFADEHGMDVSIQTVVEPAHGVQHLPVEELREVVATMERQEVDLLAHLDRNHDGWLRQLARLRAEVDERADGRARPW
ncbi:MAG: SPASM domain-containing protein [Acidimicrobiales bacterium]